MEPHWSCTHLPASMPARPTWLLASDMDGTVIPLDRAPGRAEEIRALSAALGGVQGLALAYVTGRSLSLATKGIDDFALPPAEFLAVDVGTRIFRRSRTGYVADTAYDRRMVEAVGGTDLDEISRALDDLPGLEPQPEWQQGRFKRSFFVDPSIPEDELLAAVGERMRAEGARVALVTSHDPLADVGLLDMLPRGVAKDAALHHLRTSTGAPPDRVVYAGDSGNDMAAFLAGYSGIVVGNAPDSLRERLGAVATGAVAGRRVFFAEAPFAGGVLEGLRHYGVV